MNNCSACGNICPVQDVCEGGTCVPSNCFIPNNNCRGIGTPESPGASCQYILLNGGSNGDGVYTLTDGTNLYEAYCDMTTDGGGWTLALKVDGMATTFTYDSSLWTTADLYQPTFPDEDTIESKLESFDVIPASEVLVKMSEEGTTMSSVQALAVPLPSPETLLAVFSSNTLIPTALGPAAWQSLMPDSSLQPNCNLEGFNVLPPAWVAVRIGIVANQEYDCLSTDSRIGIGGTNAPCFGDPNLSVGNICGCDCIPGDANIYAFGWVFMR